MILPDPERYSYRQAHSRRILLQGEERARWRQRWRAEQLLPAAGGGWVAGGLTQTVRAAQGPLSAPQRSP